MVKDTGIIFNIQRYSIHDGPGIRTVAFFKGCNLSCWWCHNPEGVLPIPQIQFFPDKCIGCTNCISECSNKCFSNDNQLIFNREKCVVCGNCVNVCYSNALNICGKSYSVDQLVNELKKDIDFYSDTGGVTFSGGECMLQYSFLLEVLKKCKLLKIHTAIETAANVPFQYFEKILPYLDLAIVDIKCISEELHKKNVGSSNKLILENINYLLNAKNTETWIRIPIIPGFNTSETELCKIAKYIKNLKGVSRIELMKYHSLGITKLQSLGLKNEKAVTNGDEFDKAVNIFLKHGLIVRTHN